VLVADLSRARVFYRDVLDLQIDPSRPDFGFPGGWLSVGRPQIHLRQLPNADPATGRAERGGRDRHSRWASRALSQ
jgi:glyoxylase I family protein